MERHMTLTGSGAEADRNLTRRRGRKTTEQKGRRMMHTHFLRQALAIAVLFGCVSTASAATMTTVYSEGFEDAASDFSNLAVAQTSAVGVGEGSYLGEAAVTVAAGTSTRSPGSWSGRGINYVLPTGVTELQMSIRGGILDQELGNQFFKIVLFFNNATGNRSGLPNDGRKESRAYFASNEFKTHSWTINLGDLLGAGAVSLASMEFGFSAESVPQTDSEQLLKAYVDDITITHEAIPEPASLALLGLGGLLMLPRRRAS